MIFMRSKAPHQEAVDRAPAEAILAAAMAAMETLQVHYHGLLQ